MTTEYKMEQIRNTYALEKQIVIHQHTYRLAPYEEDPNFFSVMMLMFCSVLINNTNARNHTRGIRFWDRKSERKCAREKREKLRTKPVSQRAQWYECN